MTKRISKIVKGVGLSSCILGFSLLVSPSVVEAKRGPVLPVDDGTVYNGSSSSGTVDVPERGLNLDDYKAFDIVKVNVSYVTDGNDNVGEYTFDSRAEFVPVTELKLPDGYELDDSEPILIQHSFFSFDFEVKVKAKNAVAETDPSTPELDTSANAPTTPELGTSTDAPTTSEVVADAEVETKTEKPAEATDELPTNTNQVHTQQASTKEISIQDTSIQETSAKAQDVSTSAEEELPATGYQGKNFTFVGLGLSLVSLALALLVIRFR